MRRSAAIKNSAAKVTTEHGVAKGVLLHAIELFRKREPNSEIFWVLKRNFRRFGDF
jgi:hypothetical protein